MHRRRVRPYGQSVSGFRLMSLLMATLVLWMLYVRLKDPATWRAFADDEGSSSKPAPVAVAPAIESLIPGPNDLDESEVVAAQDLFEKIVDRAPMKSREMDAYWKLIDWSRTQPFEELEQRAKSDVPFTLLWEQPEKYRGKPMLLRLRVRRVLTHDAPENPSNIATVYEAWGWTDDSKSFPYVVIFPEPPEGLPIGQDVRTEIVFVGYFLKIMSYTAFEKARGAPLLVGRARLVPPPIAAAPSKSDPWIFLLVVAGGIVLVGFSIWTGIKSRNKSKRQILPNELSMVGPQVESDFVNPFEQIALGQTAPDEQSIGQPHEVSVVPTSGSAVDGTK